MQRHHAPRPARSSGSLFWERLAGTAPWSFPSAATGLCCDAAPSATVQCMMINGLSSPSTATSAPHAVTGPERSNRKLSGYGCVIPALGSLLACSFASMLNADTHAETAPRPAAAALARPCLTCHPARGPVSAGAPALSMPEARLLGLMRDFRSGTRTGSVMNRIARGYRDEDFIALARFFSRPDGLPR